jgi:ABC-2 type transport system permease protein
MLHLLKIEWMKLKNYRTFWVLSILYLISIFAANFVVYSIQERIFRDKQAGGMAEMMLGPRPYSFPLNWQMTTYVSSFLLFIPGLLIIMIVTNEYNYRTHRQNIIDGLSRKQFISVKMVMTLIMAVLSTLIVFLTAVSFGLLQKEAFSTTNIQFVGYYFLQALSYGMFALLLGVIFKRAGLALGIFFLYSLVIENFMGGILNYFTKTYGRYLPLESVDSLIPFPLLKEMQGMVVQPIHYPSLLVTAAIYLFLYYFVSNRKFTTDDL